MEILLVEVRVRNKIPTVNLSSANLPAAAGGGGSGGCSLDT